MASTLRIAAVMAVLMCAASLVGAIALRAQTATHRRAPSIVLEQAVPTQFGDWRAEPSQSALVVNPQTQQLLDKLYGQVLARTYVNAQGYRIMLSIAYGSHRDGALQAHKPEVCYPAQGFTLLHSEDSEIGTIYGVIRGRRMNSQLGNRIEPVTYWFTMGDATVRSRFEQRLAQVRHAFTGELPDGLLFRVSSTDADTNRAHGQHDRFVNELLDAVTAAHRVQLSGLRAARFTQKAM